jgi:hypothetical protein
MTELEKGLMEQDPEAVKIAKKKLGKEEWEQLMKDLEKVTVEVFKEIDNERSGSN